MSEEEGNSRSERLRRRRSSRQQQSESSETSKPSEPSESSESVKDEMIGTYMYLPESVKKDLDRQFTLLKAEYEYEFGEELEKNRHFYPLVVSYGLDRLEGADASDLREMLDDIR